MPIHLSVYMLVFLVAMLYQGIRACFVREVGVRSALRTCLLLAVMGFLALSRMHRDAGMLAYAIAVAGLLCGEALGSLQARRWTLRFMPAGSGMRVRLPADPSLLLALVLLVAGEIALHAACAGPGAWPGAWPTQPFTRSVEFALWGLLVGLPLGRSIQVMSRGARHARR